MAADDPYALPTERQQEIIDAQLDAFRADRFQHVLNVARLEALPEDKQDAATKTALADAQDAIATIESAIDTTLAQSDAIVNGG